MKIATVSLVTYLVLFLLAMTPLQSMAMLVPSSGIPGALESNVAPSELEAKLIQDRLVTLGLTPQEAQARMQDLSEEQIHQVAQNLDGLQMGGDGLIVILAIVGAVVLVLFLISAVTGTAHDAGHAAAGH